MTDIRGPGARRVRVYGFWRSQATFRVRVALNLKGIEYQEISIGLDRGEQDESEFRRINPLGAVPTMIVEGQSLTQSAAILEYLDETHPSPPLLPADPLGRARVRSLAALAISDSHPLIVPRVRRYLAAQVAFDTAAWKAWQAHWFATALRGFEARLADDPSTGTFCHGDTPTLADICLTGLRAGARTFEIDIENIPTVERIVAHCRRQPAFAAAEAERQADFRR